MEFLGNDPGAVRFGNFINYYQFNSAADRLKLLPTDNWLSKNDDQLEPYSEQPYLVLDVGCNSGVFTQLLQPFLSQHTGTRKVQILGVDIDSHLIDTANMTNKHEDISYKCMDIMDEISYIELKQYLSYHNREKFDAVCCFSITMWIHLNHDDDGLKLFLQKCSTISKLFIIEPQPWKCYRTAVRRLKKSSGEFPLFVRLKWRSNVEAEIQEYMETILGRNKTHESSPTNWKRRILCYR